MDTYNIARVQHFIIGGNQIQEIDYRLKPELPSQGFEWLHFDRAHKDARNWLKAQKEINPLIVEALLEEETRPRCAVFEEGTLLNLRAIDFKQGSEIEDFVSLRMWITPKRLVSFRKYYIPAIADAIREMEQGHVPKTVSGLVSRLSWYLTASSKAALTGLETELQIIRKSQEVSPAKENISNIIDMRSKAILLRQHLAPQRDAILTWSRQLETPKEADARLGAEEGCEAALRLMERIDTYLEQVSLLQDRNAALLSQKIQQDVSFLVNFITVFLPLIILVGIFGAHVSDTPSLSFATLVTVCVIIGSVFAFVVSRLRRPVLKTQSRQIQKKGSSD